MDPEESYGNLQQNYSRRIFTIDSHTAGEPTRLIINFRQIPGNTMREKRDHVMSRMDWIRQLITKEPRGHRHMFGALATEPVSSGTSFGLIYMDARRYPYLCGHAVIGAVTTFVETGEIVAEDGMNRILVDTPSGIVETEAKVQNGRARSVSLRMVSSFVYQSDCPLSLPGLGTIHVDLVCAGGFFAMVDVAQLGVTLESEHHSRLAALGMEIIDAANRQLSVRHPLRDEVRTVDVTEFYDSRDEKSGHGRGIVILGEGHMDRSPCGTGTTAKMTLLHHKGLIAINQPFINQGPLNSTFEGRLISETTVGDLPAVTAGITGSAHITGMHEFVLDPDDPFQEGYLL